MNLPSGCPFAPRCPYAVDVCHEKVPGHITTETGHYSACHFADDPNFLKFAPENSRTRADLAARQKAASTEKKEA